VRLRGQRRLDIRGALLITVAIAALVFAVCEVDVFGWRSPAILAAFAAFGGSLAVFVAAERRHPDPLLPAQLIRRPALRTAGSLNLLLGLWNGGEMLVLSLCFQQVLKDSPLVTGLAIAPQGIIGFAAGAFGAKMAGRIAIRRVLVVTSAVAAAGFAVLTQLPGGGHYSPLLAAEMLVGFGTAGTAGPAAEPRRGGADRRDHAGGEARHRACARQRLTRTSPPSGWGSASPGLVACRLWIRSLPTQLSHPRR
jgi:hypothetical protein